jgi:hypothetical protein
MDGHGHASNFNNDMSECSQFDSFAGAFDSCLTSIEDMSDEEICATTDDDIDWNYEQKRRPLNPMSRYLSDHEHQDCQSCIESFNSENNNCICSRKRGRTDSKENSLAQINQVPEFDHPPILKPSISQFKVPIESGNKTEYSISLQFSELLHLSEP